MKKFAAWFVLLLSLAMLGGCGSSPAASTGQEKGKALAALKIGVMPDVDSIPFIIAQEMGYFKEENLDVTLLPFKSAMERDSALQSGNLDGAISDMLAAAFAKAGGFDVKITSLTYGSYKLLAGAGTAASSPQDLAGQQVAISKNTIIEYVTDRILSAQQMPDGSIEKVVIPQIPVRLEMLQNGKLAAATLPEPLASVAIGKGARLVSGSDQLGINPGILLFTAKAAGEKQASLEALYRAYNKAIAYLQQEPQEKYIDLLIAKGGFPPAVKGVLQLPSYRNASLPPKQDLADCMQWLAERKLIEKPYAYQEIVDDRFTAP